MRRLPLAVGVLASSVLIALSVFFPEVRQHVLDPIIAGIVFWTFTIGVKHFAQKDGEYPQ
jgi:hypothetical protein